LTNQEQKPQEPVAQKVMVRGREVDVAELDKWADIVDNKAKFDQKNQQRAAELKRQEKELARREEEFNARMNPQPPKKDGLPSMIIERNGEPDINPEFETTLAGRFQSVSEELVNVKNQLNQQQYINVQMTNQLVRNQFMRDNAMTEERMQKLEQYAVENGGLPNVGTEERPLYLYNQKELQKAHSQMRSENMLNAAANSDPRALQDAILDALGNRSSQFNFNIEKRPPVLGTDRGDAVNSLIQKVQSGQVLTAEDEEALAKTGMFPGLVNVRKGSVTIPTGG
jgi:hypothetical protein